jgi:SCY1-like protein 2
MAATSLGGLGTSKATGVNGVAKTTSWEDDMWGSILDGNDVRASRTQGTITNTTIAQLQAPSPPPGNIRSSLSFPMTTTQSLPSTPKSQPAPLRPGSIAHNTPVAIAPPPRHAAPISPPIPPTQPQSQPSLAKRATSPPMAPTLSPTPALSPIPSHVRFGLTSTPQPQPISTSAAPLTPQPPPPISKPNYNVVIPSSGVFMTPSIPVRPSSLQSFGQPLSPSIPRPVSQPIQPLVAQPLVAQMSGNIMAPSTPAPLSWNPTPLAPKKITKNVWGDFDPLK